MNYVMLIGSFIITCLGALLKDLTELETLSICLIVWGIIADFCIFTFWHREEDW